MSVAPTRQPADRRVCGKPNVENVNNGNIVVALALLAGMLVFLVVSIVQLIRKPGATWNILTIAAGIGITVAAAMLFYPVARSIRSHVVGDDLPPDGVLVSDDGHCRLTLPGHWRRLRHLNDDATIQTGNPFVDQYLIVLRDSLEEFDGSLEDYATSTADSFVKNLQKARKSEPEEVDVNGHRGIRHEVLGTVGFIRLAYLHTSIEGDTGYYQVVAWTSHSRQEEHFEIFREVVDSFEEL